MRKVIADEFMTLDGVVQAPSYADEDTTAGFGHGGWHARYFDDLSMNWVIGNVRGAGGYLLGRGTYEIFAAHWPNAPQEQQVLAESRDSRDHEVACSGGDAGGSADAVPGPSSAGGAADAGSWAFIRASSSSTSWLAVRASS
jgi:dihydrofolate reductase